MPVQLEFRRIGLLQGHRTGGESRKSCCRGVTNNFSKEKKGTAGESLIVHNPSVIILPSFDTSPTRCLPAGKKLTRFHLFVAYVTHLPHLSCDSCIFIIFLFVFNLYMDKRYTIILGVDFNFGRSAEDNSDYIFYIFQRSI